MQNNLSKTLGFQKNSKSIEQLGINAIRMLGIEMVTKANSGHPGIVLGAAPIMYTLFKNHLRFYKDDLNFINRDRFVLSAGHGSALLYATMLVAGYPSININDIKAFRQLNSKTSGHPEPHLLNGVDIGTGPLGQGAAISVGLAIAEANLNQRYNNLIDHYTYCLLGDGCMEEGVTHEALAIAGRFKLKKLIWIYDSNNVQLDGDVADSTITNFSKVVKANGWNYILVSDGNNTDLINNAINEAKNSDKPTFIEVKTIIGYASSLANSYKCHGAALSEEEVENVRKNLSYPYKKFELPDNILKSFTTTHNLNKSHYQKYLKSLDNLKKNNPQLFKQYQFEMSNEFKLDIDSFADLNKQDTITEATRNICGLIVNKIAEKNANFLIINDDLSGSTKVKASSNNKFDINNYAGQNINIGVREFSGVDVAAGIVAHGGLKAVSSTFLSFADYCKAAIRLSAINQIPILTVFSHDSITVGEDGPTHQPIEQLSMLRSIPNVITFRPANFAETYNAFLYALISKTTPVNIITSRSAFKQNKVDIKEIKNGFYFVKNVKNAKVNLIATGSDVGLCLEAADILKEQNILTNVISIPSLEILRMKKAQFKKFISKYKNNIAVEAGTTYMWYEFVNEIIGINTFGKSGKPKDVEKDFLFDAKGIVNQVKKIISKKSS